jgi:hypothetical protein
MFGARIQFPPDIVLGKLVEEFTALGELTLQQPKSPARYTYRGLAGLDAFPDPGAVREHLIDQNLFRVRSWPLGP